MNEKQKIVYGVTNFHWQSVRHDLEPKLQQQGYSQRKLPGSTIIRILHELRDMGLVEEKLMNLKPGDPGYSLGIHRRWYYRRKPDGTHPQLKRLPKGGTFIPVPT